MSLEALTQLIKETPISHILGHYLTLHRKGHQIVALCPFHDDHSPSLQINDKRNTFMCFVDRTGGDAIHFVRTFKNLSFVEALKDICDKMGLDWNLYYRPRRENPEHKQARDLVEAACQLYQKEAREGPSGVFQDFIQKRNIGPRGAELYRLGHAPGDNIICRYLRRHQLSFPLAQKLGLISQDQKTGQFYDWFRDRIMFPICDPYGSVVAFTGRATKDYQKAKYMNCRESFLFSKKDLLYGLHLARGAIKEKGRVILVEGHMDQLALTLGGLGESVALMGLALGDRALGLLDRALGPSKNFYLCLDGDSAGQQAAIKIHQCLAQRGILAHTVDLSPYKDPDELIMAKGPLELAQRLESAPLMIDVLIEGQIPSSSPPELVDRKVELINKVFQLLAPLGTNLRALERVAHWGQKLGLRASAQQLAESYREFLTQDSKSLNRFHSVRMSDIPKDSPPTGLTPSPLGDLLKKFLQLVVANPGLWASLKLEDILKIVDRQEAKELVLKLSTLFQEGDGDFYRREIKAWLERKSTLSPVWADLYEGLLVGPGPGATLEEASAVFQGLWEEKLRADKRLLRHKHSQAQDPQQSHEYLQQIFQIDRDLIALRERKQQRKQVLCHP